MDMRFGKNGFQRKTLLALALCLVFVCTGIAANSAGKPANESEVPGNWTIGHANRYKMWWNDLSTYSQAVHAKFSDPALKNEFGDHPDFTAEMRVGEEDPKAVVKVLTTAQMNAYLESLPKDNMTIQYYGDYPKGLRMPVLIFSKPKLNTPTGEALRALGKPIYYLRAQIHGNEIGASSGAVLMAQRLARGHSDWAGVLDKISIVIMPCMNLDGTKIQQRGTSLVSGDIWINDQDYYIAEGPGGGKSQYYNFMTTGRDVMVGFDQNRDNMWLGAPVSRVNARIIAEFKPEFALDAHEYGCGAQKEDGEGAFFAKVRTSPDGSQFEYVTAADRENRLELTQKTGTTIYWREQMTTQYANNLMIPEEIRNYSEKIQQSIVAGLAKATNPGGVYHWAPYVEGSYGYTVSEDGMSAGGVVSLGSLPADQRENMKRWADSNDMVPDLKALLVSSEGGFDPGTGRNTMAFSPAFAFLAESRSAGGRWEMERRTMGQYLTNLNYVRAILDNLSEVTAIVKKARSEVVAQGKADNIGPSNQVTIVNAFRASTYNDVVAYEAYLDDASVVTLPGNRRNARFGVVSTLDRQRPYAYIMDGGYAMADEIAFRMGHYDIRFERLAADTPLEVEALTVTKMNNRPSTAHFGLANTITAASVATVTKTFPAGSYVFYMEQQMANLLPLYFEPESPRSWIGKDVKNNAAILNKETPFYRYMKPVKIAGAEACSIIPTDFEGVTLYDTQVFSVAKLQEVREKIGLESATGQKVSVYGYFAGNLKVFLPDDAASGSWYFLNDSSQWEQIAPQFDKTFNRYYALLTSKFVHTASNPDYSEFEMVRGGTKSSENGGGGGGCNLGGAGLFVLLPVLYAGKRKNRKTASKAA